MSGEIISGNGVTNTLGARVGLASVFVTGAFGAGNTGTIYMVDGAVSNILVRREVTTTLAWTDQGGAVPWERSGLIVWDLTIPTNGLGNITSDYRVATFNQ